MKERNDNSILYNLSQEFDETLPKITTIKENLLSKFQTDNFENDISTLLTRKGPGMLLNEILQRNPEISLKVECKGDFSEGRRMFIQSMEIPGLGIYSIGKGVCKNLARDQAIIALVLQLSKHPKYTKQIQIVTYNGFNATLIRKKRLHEYSLDNPTFDSQRDLNKQNLLSDSIPNSRASNYDYNLEKFELFCFKTERKSLIDNPSNKLQLFMDSVMNYKTFKEEKICMTSTGSFSNSTMRKDYPELDIIVVFSEGKLKEHKEKFINQLTTLFFNSGENTYKSNVENQLIFYFQNDSAIFYLKEDDNITKAIVNHQQWLQQNKFDLESTIAIKIIKTWRRVKNLRFLSTCVLEWIICSIKDEAVSIKITNFFDKVKQGYLENLMLFNKEVSSELLKILTEENLKQIKEECEKALFCIRERDLEKLIK